jgi:hypothetical protein
MNKPTAKIPLAASNVGQNRRRRFFRDVFALGGATLALPRVALAQQDYWEEGNPRCSAIDESKPPAYPLTPELLGKFVRLSEVITGFSPLDQYLASDYLKRFASHPRTTASLPDLISAWDELSQSGKPLTDDVVRTRFFDDEKLRFGTQQLIYLWYLSALAMPDADKQLTWIYDEVEQYEKGLLWKAVHAHAPMMHGGYTGHWRNKPKTA